MVLWYYLGTLSNVDSNMNRIKYVTIFDDSYIQNAFLGYNAIFQHNNMTSLTVIVLKRLKEHEGDITAPDLNPIMQLWDSFVSLPDVDLYVLGD